MRHLRVTRRHLALDRSDEYLRCWDEVSTAVRQAGGNAWLFRDIEHDDRFLEFIEWSGGAAPLEQVAVAEALDALATFAPAAQSDEWEEVG